MAQGARATRRRTDRRGGIFRRATRVVARAPSARSSSSAGSCIAAPACAATTRPARSVRRPSSASCYVVCSGISESSRSESSLGPLAGFAVKRELFPRWMFGWRKRRRVDVRARQPICRSAPRTTRRSSSIDDAVAYCGGIDLTLRRWDTPEHRPVEPRRCDPKNRPYIPVHDVQMVVDGEAAAALGQRARERWEAARGTPLPPPGRAATDGRAASSRTSWTPTSASSARSARRTKEDGDSRGRALDRRGDRPRRAARSTSRISTSRRAWSPRRCVARMRVNRALEVIVITSREPRGWLEAETMGVGRQLFMARSTRTTCAGASTSSSVRPRPPGRRRVRRRQQARGRDVFDPRPFEGPDHRRRVLEDRLVEPRTIARWVSTPNATLG